MSNELFAAPPVNPADSKSTAKKPTLYGNQYVPGADGRGIELNALRFYEDNPAHKPVIDAVRQAEAQLTDEARESAMQAVTDYLLKNISIRWVFGDRPQRELGLDFSKVLAPSTEEAAIQQ